MGKIKSFLFKAYVFFLTCFFIFFVFLFILFLNSDFMSQFFYEEKDGSYSSSYHEDIMLNRMYHKTFYNINIKSLWFVARFLNISSKAFKALTEDEKQKMIADYYPTFDLTFIISDKRLLNFKNVIFDGIQAKLYDPKLTNLPFNSPDVAYFQFDGNAPLLENFLGKHVVNVDNKLVIKINERLFKILREQKFLKITLISHDDVEYSVQTDNFLSSENFSGISKNKALLYKS